MAILKLVALALLLLVPAAGWLYVATRVDEGLEDRALVTEVVDGDTLVVRAEDGERDRVRVLGIDTPERGACFSMRAAADTRRLAGGRRVLLRIDPTQPRRDRFGRLLAYVRLPDGRDLGFELIALGVARVFVVGRDFERLGSYRRAERAARTLRPSVWTC